MRRNTSFYRILPVSGQNLAPHPSTAYQSLKAITMNTTRHKRKMPTGSGRTIHCYRVFLGKLSTWKAGGVEHLCYRACADVLLGPRISGPAQRRSFDCHKSSKVDAFTQIDLCKSVHPQTVGQTTSAPAVIPPVLAARVSRGASPFLVGRQFFHHVMFDH